MSASHHPLPIAPAGQTGAEPERRPWLVLGLMLLAQFMVILDVSVVNVALPSIGTSLSFTTADYGWTVSAYVLLSGGLLLLGGRLADLIDRRRMFLIGLTLFTTASLVSGLAASPAMLIVSRAAQGMGAAMLTPAALAIVMTTYAGRQRATALAVWGTIGSMGIAAGVLFGGALTATLGWRGVFFINVPIGVAVGLLAILRVPAGITVLTSIRRLDLGGAVTAVLGLIALVFGIQHAGAQGWSDPLTFAALAAAVVLLVAFALIERRGAAPLVPPHVWRIRSLVASTAVMAGVTGAVVGSIFLNSLFLQRVLGGSAIITGLQFLPLALVITLAAAVSGKLLGTISPRLMMTGGLGITAVGAALLVHAGATSDYLTGVLPGFIVLGLGVGPLFVAISVAAMSGIRGEEAGLASGVMMTGHEVGAALGVAVLTAVGGDLTTVGGLVEAYPKAFGALTLILAALAVFAVFAVPRRAGVPD
ncbi:MFS transporter [Cryobacterium tepidiphilum]|uniref:MFS transporter n=1 Tax=Cryobacterium tepidiphilum TaxID=2486026 RepID=A0A3M8LN22_9MICO|nr:MFS transporter [Cryobacterium tepidiphilum]RNE66781.1 MFS transporter [Cryobacterium tepidiphilum]